MNVDLVDIPDDLDENEIDAELLNEFVDPFPRYRFNEIGEGCYQTKAVRYE